jgi:hypothetical protein
MAIKRFMNTIRMKKEIKRGLITLQKISELKKDLQIGLIIYLILKLERRNIN